VDQRISGGRRSHGGAEARRKQREESTTGHKGNYWRVPCSCLCVETPVVAHRCFTPPRSSILCGCINFPGRQVNAVWGRCPTACAMYIKKSLECIGGWGLVDKISPAFELRNSGVPLRLRVLLPWVYLYTTHSSRLVATGATHSPCLCVAPPGQSPAPSLYLPKTAFSPCKSSIRRFDLIPT
jgi:hypothetical protein